MSREKTITDNLGLVHACCKRFVSRGIEYDDLYQAGCVGLIKAVDAFDEDKGVKLSTYAVPVILGEIKRLFRDGGTVKVSRSLKETSMKIQKAKPALSLKLGREPTVTELSKELGIKPELLTEAICSSQPTLSLTADSEREEKQFDIPVASHETEITDKIGIKQLIDTLPAKDKKLIELRFYKSMTQQKTAGRLGMSQVQVSRREKIILMELRKKLG